LIFLFVGLHERGFFNLVNFQSPLLCGLGPKLQSPMILTRLAIRVCYPNWNTSFASKIPGLVRLAI